MTAPSTEAAGFDIALGDIADLSEVVDREALRDICRSFFDLFNLSVRIYAADDTLLASVSEPAELYTYLQKFPKGRKVVSETVDQVKRTRPTDSSVLRHQTIMGIVYDVVPITYQGRPVGRFVIGPFVPAELEQVPKALVRLDPNLDRLEVRALLMKLPRVRANTAERITSHLRGVLDLLLFSSHRAHLTSEMHVASVRESYRELAEKTSKLQHAYDRLKELDQLKSNFLATVSHELRTPLTSIIGYSEMLEANIAGELTGEQREFVETIHQKGNQLLGLISSLLDLSKLEQGVMRLTLSDADPKAVIGDLASTFLPHAMKREIAIETACEEGLPTLRVDPLRLKQILSNLAENAIKFSADGGTVRFAARYTDWEDDADGAGAVLMGSSRGAVAFDVVDTGIGMRASELEKIFDAFYQVDGSATREHGGTGLGLSIVKRLVEAHGGNISVTSTYGEGTTFTVTIPEPEE